MTGFYRGNLFRLAGLLLVVLSFFPLDVYLLRKQLKQSGSSFGSPLVESLASRLSQSLPTLLMTLATLALPRVNLLYAGTGFVGTLWAFRHSSRLRALCLYYFVLLGLPVLLFMRAFACDCAKPATVKANMHSLQTVVETYGEYHQGNYPQNIEEMRAQAIQSDYWKEFTNPYTGSSGLAASYQNYAAFDGKFQPAVPPDTTPEFADYVGIRIYRLPRPAIENAGLVLYQPVSLTKYFIYGLDQSGRLIQDKGHAFTLSNY